MKRTRASQERATWQAWALISRSGAMGRRSMLGACAVYFSEQSARKDCTSYLRAIPVTIRRRKGGGG